MLLSFVKRTGAMRLEQITGEAGTPAVHIGQVVEREDGQSIRLI
jgi:hypothetical protein